MRIMAIPILLKRFPPIKRSQSSFLISLGHSITGSFLSLEAEASALGGAIGASIATF